MKQSTHTHKFTAEQVAEWNKRQLEINFDEQWNDYNVILQPLNKVSGC